MMTKTTDRASREPCATPRLLKIRAYRQELTPNPERLGPTRHVLAVYLRCWGWEEVVETAVTCVTEMLANVHQHAGGKCVLLLEATQHGIRITVSDTSTKLPQVRQPDWFSDSGRGMWLLSRTAHDWGAEVTPTGKDVWVELRASAKWVPA